MKKNGELISENNQLLLENSVLLTPTGVTLLTHRKKNKKLSWDRLKIRYFEEKKKPKQQNKP